MPTTTTIQCPGCGTPNQAVVENLIDVTRNPALKSALLNGRLNNVRCANCGTVSTVASPLLYHDASKELLISFVPMELGLSRDQQDRVVGDMLKQMTAGIPNEEFRGYMFQPRQALTLAGLVEQILEADGVTPDMMDHQRQIVELIENLLSGGPDQLETQIQAHDDVIDAAFFQAALAMTQRAAEDGREDMVNALLMLQEKAAELSTYGQQMSVLAEQREQIVREVAQRIQSFGDSPRLDDIVGLAVELGHSDDHLQALAGLIRPALDYQFFQTLAAYIDQAAPDKREKIEHVRARLLEFTQIIDEQAQMAMREAARVLQAIATSEDVDAAIAEYGGLIDEMFLSVLSANIQQADIQASARLKEIYQKVMVHLQNNMRPELKYINALLSTENDEQALALLPQGIAEFGPALLDVMDNVGQMLGQNGNYELVQKLAFLREAVAHQLE